MENVYIYLYQRNKLHNFLCMLTGVKIPAIYNGQEHLGKKEKKVCHRKQNFTPVKNLSLRRPGL